MAGVTPPRAALARIVGLPGAVLLGLGSILGTGIFVSIGVAAVVAAFNGLSSAQLAARHPVSGGTYEYGYRWIGPSAGFTAGWTFLVAKSASAATAALGVSGYLLHGLGVDGTTPRIVLAVALTALLTWIVSTGIRRSNRANSLIVGTTLVVLVAFVVSGLIGSADTLVPDIGPPDAFSWSALLHGTALMFVAYTGYGRIATLGEEVRDPARTIPRAIVMTLVVTIMKNKLQRVAIGAGAGIVFGAALGLRGHRNGPGRGGRLAGFYRPVSRRSVREPLPPGGGERPETAATYCDGFL